MNDLPLADEMRRAADHLHPPVDRLVDGGMRRGRTLRRRHRAAEGVAAFAVVGLTGGAVAVAPSVFAGHNATGQAAAPTHPGRPWMTQVTLSPAAGGSAQSAQFGVPPGQMATTLAGLLSGGTTSGLRTWSGGGFQAGSLTYDDGSGAAEVDVLVEDMTQEQQTWVQPPAKGGSIGYQKYKSIAGWRKKILSLKLHAAAAKRKAQSAAGLDADQPAGTGRLVTIADSPEYGGDNPGGVVSNIVSWYVDGFCVTVTAYNAVAEKGTTADRSAPALSIAQLTAIAENSVWIQ